MLLKSEVNPPSKHYNSERFQYSNIKVDEETIAVTKPCFTLISGKHKLENYTFLAIAKILEVRSDGSLIPDPSFIAPSFFIQNSQQLMYEMRKLHADIRQKTISLGELCSLSIHSGAGITVSHIDLALLEIYNHFEVYLQQVIKSSNMHPQEVYYKLAEFSGKLSTYLDESKMSKAIKSYNHSEISSSFLDIIAELKTQFSIEIVRPAVRAILEQGIINAYFSTNLPPNKLFSFSFILIVSAHRTREDIKRYLPGQCKVSAGSQIENHFRNISTGVVIEPLGAVPMHVPYFSDAVYFEIPQVEKFADAWEQINAEGCIALHITGDYPSLKLQLWLVKKEEM